MAAIGAVVSIGRSALSAHGERDARCEFQEDPDAFVLPGLLLRITTLALTFYGLSTFYVVWLIQPYWEAYGVPLALFGVLWAAKNFVVAIAARFCAPLEEKYGPAPILVAVGVLPVIGYFGMAMNGGLMGILLAFSFYISRGFHQVILTDAFNKRVPSEFRATANSLTGFLFRLTFIVTGPLVGYLYEWQGMMVTLYVLGAACVLLLFVLLLPLIREVNARIDEAAPDTAAL